MAFIIVSIIHILEQSLYRASRIDLQPLRGHGFWMEVSVRHASYFSAAGDRL